MAALESLIRQRPPTWWDCFTEDPIRTLARTCRRFQIPAASEFVPLRPAIRVVCLSDTHNTQPEVPPGDLLVHAGDLTRGGSFHEVQQALTWLNSLPHLHKVVIAGNHDLLFDDNYQTADKERRHTLEWGNVIYLQDSSTTLRFPGGRVLKIYGSPWTRYGGNWAFQYHQDKDAWSGSVPEDTDILITHSPPRFHLDSNCFGDDNLLQEVWRVQPKLHVFGHVHSGRSQEVLSFDKPQALYENTLRTRSPWISAQVFWHSITCYWRSKPLGKTILVNAAVVGGFRDREIRPAIALSI